MNETVRKLVERRSCRSFRPEHITREALEQIYPAQVLILRPRNLK